MTLQTPNLDDRDFNELVASARRRLVQLCPGWTDLSPSDPGIVLLELFAYLTDVMIYRLNRLPEKAYIEFLRLMGVRLYPPSAAMVRLSFSLNRPAEQPVEIPRGTRVTVGRTSGGTEPPVFVTTETVTIPSGQTQVETVAFNCELVEAELAGVGTGLPGLSVTAQRPPIVAATSANLDLIVAVEATTDELSGRVSALEYNGKSFRIWHEVDSFTNLKDERHVYIADRATGTIVFAPAVQLRADDGALDQVPQGLADAPAAGREIRLWYFRGGGPDGNVAAHTLTTLKDSLPGVTVTNPDPATGGRQAETIQNALLRGPQELHSLRRAVTASDFELVALRSSGAIARAKAFTKAQLWAYAPPGTVEVLLVPNIPQEQRAGGRLTLSTFKSYETAEVVAVLQQALEERRPLGTTCLVNWVRYKNVRVVARVVVHRGEDSEAVRNRVLNRLYERICPLPIGEGTPAWPFGQSLRASHVYDIVLAERGVSYVDRVRLFVDEVPKQIRALAADYSQPRTWYAADGSKLFRSVNDGDGWELLSEFNNEDIDLIQPHPDKAGLLTVITQLSGEGAKGSRLHVSEDCGEHWREIGQIAFAVNDAAWTMRAGVPLLLLATDNGLYELILQQGATPVQVLVDPSDQTLGFYAVTTTTGILGTYFVAVAGRNSRGVFLSSQAGKPRTFVNIGLVGEDVRVLMVQQDGVRTFLWAGLTAFGTEEGKGCFRWELRGSEPPQESPFQFQNGWTGGSCNALSFVGPFAMAATFDAGVLWLDVSKGEGASWHSPAIDCGLPIRDVARIFQPVHSLASDSERVVMAGGPVGVYRSQDNGVTYESCSRAEFTEQVTLPETWLFCSGEHQIEVVTEP